MFLIFQEYLYLMVATVARRIINIIVNLILLLRRKIFNLMNWINILNLYVEMRQLKMGLIIQVSLQSNLKSLKSTYNSKSTDHERLSSISFNGMFFFIKYRFSFYPNNKNRSHPTTKTKGGGIIMYIPKFLKHRLRDDLNCFPDTNFESLWVELNIQKRNAY